MRLRIPALGDVAGIEERPYGVEHMDSEGRVTHRHFREYEAAIFWANFAESQLQLSVRMFHHDQEIAVPEMKATEWFDGAHE